MERDWGMLVFGSMILAIGVVLLIRTVRHLAHGVITTGLVTDIIKEVSDDETMYSAVVRFRDLDGNERTFRDTLKRSWKHRSIGQKIPVSYVPEEPENATIDGPLEHWMAPVVCLTIGVMTCLFGLFRALGL